LSWAVGSGAVAYWFGTFYHDTINSMGGAAKFAALAQPTADAMRPLTGPAERLDTYGGYFTYHNLGYVILFLGIYAAIQGARAARGDEEAGLTEMWLSTGRPRWVLLRDRLVSFVLVLCCIVVGAGTGIGVGAVAAGQPDWSGAFAAMFEIALTALVCYGIGMVVAQLTRTGRAGAAVSGFTIVGLYFVNTMSSGFPFLAQVRWISPFALAEQSRTLIPGNGVQPWATLALCAAALLFPAAGMLAYQRRDSGAALLTLRRNQHRKPNRIRLRTLGLRDLWTASLREQRLALAAWILGNTVLEWLYVGLGHQVVTAWRDNQFIRSLLSRSSQAPLEDQYVSFTVTMTLGVAVAYVIVQSARWLSDIEHGRAEMALAHGVSRSRLVLERTAALVAGVTAVAAGGVAGIALGAWSSGMTINSTGIMRTVGATVLMSLAVGGVGLLIVAWLRSGLAIALLTLLLAASWVITLFGGLAKLPDWVLRISVFDAFGEPYIGPLRTGSVIYLVAALVIGVALAVGVSRTRSSIAA
jgi:ABC-2 type transport system permease protein